jgi:hypothetical protein
MLHDQTIHDSRHETGAATVRANTQRTMLAYGTHPQSQPAAPRQPRLPLTDGSSSDGSHGAARRGGGVCRHEWPAESGDAATRRSGHGSTQRRARAVRAVRPAASIGVGVIGSGGDEEDGGSDEDASAGEAGSATSGSGSGTLAPLPPSLLLAPLLPPPLARALLPPLLLLLPPPPPPRRRRCRRRYTGGGGGCAR